MWQSDLNQKLSTYKNDDLEKAHKAAVSCPDFREDCEDECVSDDPVSCYNCRYRRWTYEGFDCLKGVSS